MLPFEHLLLELGGREIFEDLLGKYVKADETFVYAWQNTEQTIDFRLDDFLTVDDYALFNKRYQKERDMQFSALDEN